jgi:hypothetical protein
MPPKRLPPAFFPSCRPRPAERVSSRLEWPCNIPVRGQVTPFIPAPKHQAERRFPEGRRPVPERYCRKGHPRASLQPYQAFPRRVVPSHDAPRGKPRAMESPVAGPKALVGPGAAEAAPTPLRPKPLRRPLHLPVRGRFGSTELRSRTLRGPRRECAGTHLAMRPPCAVRGRYRPLAPPKGCQARSELDTWQISQDLAQRQACVPEGTRVSLWPISGLRMQTRDLR